MARKKDIKLDLRSEPDFISKSVGVLTAVCWILTISAVIIAGLALPAVRNSISTAFKLDLKPAWSKLLYHIDFCVLAVIFVASAVGFYFNLIRRRRRTDTYNSSLICFWVLSALCMAAYYFFFQKIL